VTGAGLPRRVWVTRTRPAADATAERLAALGLLPIVAPVLAARPIVDAAVDLVGVDAIAFTSGHAVTAFAALSAEREPVVFAVGAATAQAARRLGFGRVVVGTGGAGALAPLIAAAEPRPARVLIPTAAEPSADLAGLLASLGVGAVTAAVYETIPTGAFAPLSEIDAILIHSARAAALVADHLAGQDEAARLAAYAISETAAAPLRAAGLRSVQASAAPTESALLALLA
jgi:uroporphyrinogen-III synthase